MDEQHEKKEFNYPKREQVIDQIKALDDDIEHVSLNLIKCNFDATEKDVEKTFPQFKFIKVKNYNPGSFEIVFEMKIDAINFIRNCFDRKILNRRFFIKMGRQHKEVVEDWACVGYVPRKFNQPHRGPGQHNKDGKDGKPYQKRGHKDGKNENNPQGENTENKQTTKTEAEGAQKQVVVEQKPKVQKNQYIHYHKQEHKKEYVKHQNKESKDAKKPEEGQKKTDGAEKKSETSGKWERKGDLKPAEVKKQDIKQQKKEQKREQPKPKPVETKKQAPVEAPKKQVPVQPKKQKPAQQPKKESVKQVQQTKAEDDEWITVPAKPTKGKKR